MNPKIITIANQKGGCAKTTTTNNLGASLALAGKNVLIIDLDPQANLSFSFGIELEEDELSSYQFIMGKADPEDVIRSTCIENLYIVPSSIELAGAEIELTRAIAGEKKLYNVLKKSEIINNFDYVLIDTPPFFSNLLTNGLSTSKYVIVPVKLRRYDISGLNQLLDHIDAVRENVNENLKNWFILPVMIDLRQKEDREVFEVLKEKYEDNLLPTSIKNNIKVAEAVKAKKPVILYDKNCIGSVNYIELAIKIEEVIQ